MKTKSSAAGYRVLVFCGFALAGVLTVSLAISLRLGDILRTILNAGLLWATVTLLVRNLDNLAKAVGRGAKPENAESPASGPGPDAS